MLALAAALIVLVGWALDPATLRAAAEARLGSMLGQPVRIGEVRLSWFPRLTVVGSRVAIGDGGENALSLERVVLHPRLWTLAGDTVVIDDVYLDGLGIPLRRDQAGSWHAPPVLPEPASRGGGRVAIERIHLERGRVRVVDEGAGGAGDAASIDDIQAEVVAEADGLRFSSLAGRIGSAAIQGSARLDRRALNLTFEMPRIEDGDLDVLLRLARSERPGFLALAQPAAAAFEARIDRASGRLAGSGEVRAPLVSLDTLRIEGFQAPVTLKNERLVFDPATFTVYGGTERGTLAFDLSRTPVRWALAGRAAGLDIGDFLEALTGADQRLDGTAAVDADLQGRVGDALDEITGRAAITVTGGAVRDFPLLAAINRALRLAEGDSRETRFERLSATLAIAGGRATTKDLRMDAREVRLQAAGRIDFDRTLHLAGHAVLSPERTARAIRSVHELAGLRSGAGELELPITITGSLDQPSFQIDLKAAIAKSLKEELRRRLRDWIKR
jgi:uncharacterized protein involved in outer membrane biogenesis